MMTMTMMIMIRMIITNEHTSGTSVLCWLSSPSLRIHHVPFILATLWDPVVLKNTIQDLRSGDPHPPAMHHHKIQDPQCSCNTRCSIHTPPRDLVFQQYTRKLKTGVLVSATTITPETPRLRTSVQVQGSSILVGSIVVYTMKYTSSHNIIAVASAATIILVIRQQQ